MRVVLIAVAIIWGIAALLAFVQTQQKSADAKLSASFFLAWPVLMFLVYINQPLPLWVNVPVLFGFLPWFLAGPHLWGILRDGAESKPGEWIGVPVGYWKWGSIGALLLSFVFNSLV